MDIEPTIAYGREIAYDIYGSPLVFETRLAAETFPGITTPVVGPVLVLHVWELFDDSKPASVDAIAFHEPTFCGRNARLYFQTVSE